jgi:predicted membrane protein
LFGGSLIWRTTARYRLSADKQHSGDGDSFMNLFAFMGGFKRTNDSQNFVGGEMTAIMGGCEIDLRRASIKDGEAVIDVFAFWGGVLLKVPEDWSVIVQGLPIMGGIEDKTRPSSNTSKRLVVKGYAIMGGVEIRN